MNDEIIEIGKTICEIGERLYRFGHVVSNDGNISFRLDETRILTTPTGVCKGDMNPESMVIVDLDGNTLGPGKASSELPMHLFIYQQRPDIQAVVHAHPVTATACAASGIALDQKVLPEIIATLGSIPLAPFGMPGTREVPESLRPYLSRHDAVLLANHGVVTFGPDLWDAYFKMERVEHYARILLASRSLGGEKDLTPEQVKQLSQMRTGYGQGEPAT